MNMAFRWSQTEEGLTDGIDIPQDRLIFLLINGSQNTPVNATNVCINDIFVKVMSNNRVINKILFILNILDFFATILFSTNSTIFARTFTL